ncbi:hypothetical protein MN608_05531 [Microdochium nivale]|nr:hypothetical protein MN608_05531 [Microdochium nivale]
MHLRTESSNGDENVSDSRLRRAELSGECGGMIRARQMSTRTDESPIARLLIEATSRLRRAPWQSVAEGQDDGEDGDGDDEAEDDAGKLTGLPRACRPIRLSVSVPACPSAGASALDLRVHPSQPYASLSTLSSSSAAAFDRALLFISWCHKPSPGVRLPPGSESRVSTTALDVSPPQMTLHGRKGLAPGRLTPAALMLHACLSAAFERQWSAEVNMRL